MLTRYAVATVVVLLVAAGLMSLLFHGPRDAVAIWSSAAVALIVQFTAFGLGRVVGRGPAGLMARMGTGALVRFVALIAYAVLVALVLKLPLVAALISMAAFFFLMTLVEPFVTRP